MTTSNRKSHLAVRALCEGAVMVVLAQVLGHLKLWEMPWGGSICLSMLPIFFYACRWGVGWGLLAGFVLGVLQFMFDGGFALGWQSIIGDYLVAFTVLGLAGLFRGRNWSIFAGTVLGCFARFVVHFISGVTIYRIYAPTEILGTVFDNPTLYSIVYNGSYMLPNTILALVIAALLYAPLKKFYLGADIQR